MPFKLNFKKIKLYTNLSVKGKYSRVWKVVNPKSINDKTNKGSVLY